MCRILFAAKHSWTALRMSRPLFVGSYLQVTWWALDQWKERKIASNDNVDYLPVKIKLTYILACLLDLAAKNRWTAVWLTAQSGNKPNAPPMTKVHIDRRWVGSGLRLFRGENKQLTSRKLLVHGTIKFAKMNHNFDYKARPVSIDLWSPSVAHSYTVSTGNHMILSAIRNK